MLDLGPHASFIIAAYGVTAIALAGLVLATVADDFKQRHLLAELERQGIKRRSAAKTAPRATKPAAKANAAPAAKTKAARSGAKKAAPKRKAASPRKRKSPS